jgi:hypothetical protein
MKVTMPKPFALVLMPFKDEFKDIYEIGIREACEKAGVYCERIDEQIGTILPSCWSSLQLDLDAYQGPVEKEMTVRVYTELGTLDYPVTF